MKFIDPTGMELKLTGEEAQAAFAEMQKAASQGLVLTIGDDGNMSYTLNNNHKLTDKDQDIINIIDNKSIYINMLAEKGPFSSINGAMFAVGQFGGNTINTDEKGNRISVNVKQVINPSQMSELGNNFNTPRIDMMHELSEAYIGGQNALKYGIKGEPTIQSINTAYKMAHDEAATKYPNSPFTVYARYKDGNMTQNQNLAVGYIWYYIDQKINHAKILQRIGN